jgi:hypothetical protein
VETGNLLQAVVRAAKDASLLRRCALRFFSDMQAYRRHTLRDSSFQSKAGFRLLGHGDSWVPIQTQACLRLRGGIPTRTPPAGKACGKGSKGYSDEPRTPPKGMMSTIQHGRPQPHYCSAGYSLLHWTSIRLHPPLAAAHSVPLESTIGHSLNRTWLRLRSCNTYPNSL